MHILADAAPYHETWPDTVAVLAFFALVAFFLWLIIRRH